MKTLVDSDSVINSEINDNHPNPRKKLSEMPNILVLEEPDSSFSVKSFEIQTNKISASNKNLGKPSQNSYYHEKKNSIQKH